MVARSGSPVKFLQGELHSFAHEGYGSRRATSLLQTEGSRAHGSHVLHDAFVGLLSGEGIE